MTMIYFEEDKISQLLNIPENEVPVIILITTKM